MVKTCLVCATRTKLSLTNYSLRHSLNLGGAMAGEQGRCSNCGSDQVVRAAEYNRGEKGVEQRYLYRS
jgi:hypothetical protein